MAEEIKCYELDFGDTNVIDPNIDVIIDWIRSDMESMGANDELEYKITIRYMTQKEIDELPEWS